MRRKEALFAVIGGSVGAVLVMVVGSFSPLGAQSVSDGNFGKITCTRLEVVRPDGIQAALIFVDEDGGGARKRDREGPKLTRFSIRRGRWWESYPGR